MFSLLVLFDNFDQTMGSYLRYILSLKPPVLIMRSWLYDISHWQFTAASCHGTQIYSTGRLVLSQQSWFWTTQESRLYEVVQFHWLVQNQECWLRTEVNYIYYYSMTCNLRSADTLTTATFWRYNQLLHVVIPPGLFIRASLVSPPCASLQDHRRYDKITWS